MTNLDINATIILATLFVIYGIFLFFDAFKRNEKYAYLAYVAAVVPINYMWILGFDLLLVYIVLFALWDVCLLRDLVFVYRKTKEFDDVVLFLILAIIIQLVVTAILPADQVLPQLKTNAEPPFWVFYLPNLYDSSFQIQPWVDETLLLAFRGSITLTIFLAIIPLILDIKGEAVPFPVLVVIDGIFVIPFLILSYIWLPQAIGVLTFLLAVILLIILLIITRSGKEEEVK